MCALYVLNVEMWHSIWNCIKILFKEAPTLQVCLLFLVKFKMVD